MSILIRGMEMPKACVYRENGHLVTCPLYDIDGYCGALRSEASHKENEKLSDCPLIPVPSHGRLIDANAIPYNKIMLEDNDYYYGVTKPYIDRMPTIIPAEEGE